MEKENWKKVFASIPDDTLVDLIQVWNIEVNGFRQITKENIKKARKRAIIEALKFGKLKQIKMFYSLAMGTQADEKEELTNYREQNLDELMNSYAEGDALHFILGGLFSSDEDMHHDLADLFLQKLFETYEASSIEELLTMDEEEEDDSSVAETTRHASSEYEKKVEKLELKIQKLQKQAHDWESKYSTLNKEYKQEKQQWAKERQQLCQEITSEKNQLKAVEKKCQEHESDKQQLKQELELLKGEIAHLHAQMLHQKKEVAVTSDEVIEQPEILGLTQHILVIGDPKNKIFEQSQNPTYHILNYEDIKERVEADDFQQFDEIWVLEYLIPPTIKRKMARKHQQKSIFFKDFQSIKRHIEKGKQS